MIRTAIQFAQHGAGQVVAQLAGLGAGILIVRGLDKPEYAAYSLAIWMIAAIGVVSDSGISAVLISYGADARNRPGRLAILFSTARKYRLLIVAITVIGGGTWLTYLLLRSGTSLSDTILTIAGLVCAALPTVWVGMGLAYHRIELNASRLRVAAWLPPVVRLALVAAAMLLGLMSLITVLALAVLIAGLTMTILLWRTGTIFREREVDDGIARSIRASVKHALPMAVLIVVTEQILFAVITLRGSSEVLAEFAALSRFGLVFAVVNPVIADLVASRVARIQTDRRAAAGIVLIGGGYLVVVATFVGVVWLTAPWLLALLGTGYKTLALPLVVICLGYGIAYLGHAMNYLTQARNWVAGSWSYLPLAAMWAGYALVFADASSIVGAAWLFVAQASISVVSQVIRVAIGLRYSR